MNTCYKCGEYAKCRKELIDVSGGGAGVGYSHMPILRKRWTCKRCDDALNQLSMNEEGSFHEIGYIAACDDILKMITPLKFT